jgi:Ca2+-binding EF-hand superfamily protein
MDKKNMKKYAIDAFNKFDINKNGFIDLDELNFLLEDIANELGIPAPDEQEVVNLLKEYDTNKDKKISQEEFYDLFEVFTQMRENQ